MLQLLISLNCFSHMHILGKTIDSWKCNSHIHLCYTLTNITKRDAHICNISVVSIFWTKVQPNWQCATKNRYSVCLLSYSLCEICKTIRAFIGITSPQNMFMCNAQKYPLFNYTHLDFNVISRQSVATFITEDLFRNVYHITFITENLCWLEYHTVN